MKRSTLIWILISFISVVGAALLHVALRLDVIRLGYAIGTETEARHRLAEEGRRLRLEKSLLRNPERIERLARDKLGMHRPDPTRIRVVRWDGVDWLPLRAQREPSSGELDWLPLRAQREPSSG